MTRVHVFNSERRGSLLQPVFLSHAQKCYGFFGNEFCCHPASTHKRIGGAAACAWLSVSRLPPPPLCPFCCREIRHRVELMNNKTGLVCLEGKKKKMRERRKKKNRILTNTHSSAHSVLEETTDYNNAINRKTNLKPDRTKKTISKNPNNTGCDVWMWRCVFVCV